MTDLSRAKKYGIQKYQDELNGKIEILEYLINNYNDGRRKGFYCIAVNLLKLNSLKMIMKQIGTQIEPQNIDNKIRIDLVVDLIKSTVKRENVVLELRGKKTHA